MKDLIIGIDQSYTNFGIAIIYSKENIDAKSIDLSKFQNKIEKRLAVREALENMLFTFANKYFANKYNVKIIFERIRTFSVQAGGSQGFGLKPHYMIDTGKMIGTIIDIAYRYNVKCYSVDTRSWKSQVVGTTKSYLGDNKYYTVQYVQNELKIDCRRSSSSGEVLKYIRGKNAGKIKYDDDKADAICIGLYGLLDGNKQKLNLEE